jgi:hypothetical protein
MAIGNIAYIINTRPCLVAIYLVVGSQAIIYFVCVFLIFFYYKYINLILLVFEWSRKDLVQKKKKLIWYLSKLLYIEEYD